MVEFERLCMAAIRVEFLPLRLSYRAAWRNDTFLTESRARKVVFEIVVICPVDYIVPTLKTKILVSYQSLFK